MDKENFTIKHKHQDLTSWRKKENNFSPAWFTYLARTKKFKVLEMSKSWKSPNPDDLEKYL